MSIKTSLTLKISTFVANINIMIEEIIKNSIQKNSYLPALAGSGQSLPSPSGSSGFDLREIFNGILWCPTPKKRTTAEKKLTKRFTPLPENFITKYAKPKTNIITCIECGSYHEKGTICGECYKKVKEETERVQEELFKREEFKFNHPTKEVKFVYEDDTNTKDKNDESLIVKIPKTRPSWFNVDLIPKVNSSKKN